MERERITISIKKTLLNDIDKTIDGVQIRNRSHAIETLASKGLKNSNINKAVLLLGGKDAMEYIPAAKEYITHLKSLGFEHLYIAVGYLADKIKQKVGFGEEYGLSIEYLEKGEGSGGAILPLKKSLNSTFVVINSSKYSKIDFSRLLDYHNRFSLSATISTDNLESLEGLYIFDPKIFEYIPKGFSMLETDVFPKLFAKNEIIVFPVAN